MRRPLRSLLIQLRGHHRPRGQLLHPPRRTRLRAHAARPLTRARSPQLRAPSVNLIHHFDRELIFGCETYDAIGSRWVKSRILKKRGAPPRPAPRLSHIRHPCLPALPTAPLAVLERCGLSADRLCFVDDNAGNIQDVADTLRGCTTIKTEKGGLGEPHAKAVREWLRRRVAPKHGGPTPTTRSSGKPPSSFAPCHDPAAGPPCRGTRDSTRCK